jgi:hypothetical protein
MITTTLAVLALAGGIGSGVIPSTPNWHTDYAQAMTRSSAEGKPMAVFIGSGGEKHKKLLADGTISAEASKLLSRSYICVYLDSETPNGKDLASRFELSDGLIISSKGGSLQAFRHTGSFKAGELTASLTKYAEANQPSRTETSGATTYTPSRPANGGVIVGGYTYGTGSTPTYYVPSQQYVYPSSGYVYPSYGYPVQCTGFK